MGVPTLATGQVSDWDQVKQGWKFVRRQEREPHDDTGSFDTDVALPVASYAFSIEIMLVVSSPARS